jgi:hypothetical protein
VKEPDVKAKWLAIAKVHTNRGFSPSALFADMRSAWNPAQEVAWRKIEDNLFTIQFACLGDWNKATKQGPWVFRNQAVMIEEYDGFSNPKSVVLDKIMVWAQVLKLPDMLLKEPVIRGMCRNMGEIKEIQVKLPAGYVGEFVRLQVRIDVKKKLTRFVSVTKDKQKEWYQLKYEKLPTFCHNCGHLGHWHEECGDGVHDESNFEWGEFILAGGGRGQGRGRGAGRGVPGRAPFMGRGRGSMGGQGATWGKQDWRREGLGKFTSDENLGEGANSRKRLNFDASNPNDGTLAIVGQGNKVSDIIGRFDNGVIEDGMSLENTPGKIQYPKRTRVDDNTGGDENVTNNLSAASGMEVVREQ